MRLIGKYPVLGLLGRGGMGVVYKTAVPLLGRVAALKLLRPNELLLGLWGRERAIRSFQDEAVRLGALRHRNLVDVFDYGEHEGWPYLLMDFYGESLGSVIGETYRVEAPSRRLPVSRAVGYTTQLLSGLARLHYAGIVHRDIKPFNLLLTDDDVLKITDLGLSKVRGERFDGPANLKVGSPCYAAPEQEDDPDAADARADLYAVGVTLFRMLTGRLPEPGLPAPSTLTPDLNADWDAFLARATDPEPGRRFADAMTMRTALEELHRQWLRYMDGVCSGVSGLLAPRLAPCALGNPRFQPIKVGVREARTAFKLDELWRPAAYWPGRLEDVGRGLFYDQDAGLVWEGEAAPYPLTWSEAAAHVAQRNGARWGGFDDWRLPTVDELVTLLCAEPVGAGYCQPAMLGQPVRRVWSADRATFTAAWAADAELGYVTQGDMSSPMAVRAVRSL